MRLLVKATSVLAGCAAVLALSSTLAPANAATQASSGPATVSAQSASIDTNKQIGSVLPVATWQRSLRAWQQYYGICRPTVSVDGIFGPRTLAATKCFQRVHDLAADGIVGPDTRAAMCDELAFMLRWDLFAELC